MTTIDRAAQVFGVTLAILAGQLVDMARRVGAVIDREAFDALPAATRENVKVGALVAVYAHQRIRVARVWAVTPSKLSAVYVTPSEIDTAARYGRSPIPNNITAKIANCALVAPAASQPAPVDEPAQPREIAVDDHAAAAGMLPLAGGDGFLF
jgi:hypothetical protein